MIYLALYFRQFKQKSKMKLKTRSTIWLLEQLMYLGCKEPSKRKAWKKTNVGRREWRILMSWEG